MLIAGLVLTPPLGSNAHPTHPMGERALRRGPELLRLAQGFLVKLSSRFRDALLLLISAARRNFQLLPFFSRLFRFLLHERIFTTQLLTTVLVGRLLCFSGQGSSICSCGPRRAQALKPVGWHSKRHTHETTTISTGAQRTVEERGRRIRRRRRRRESLD